jgi:GT2 family glycosyltransferase
VTVANPLPLSVVIPTYMREQVLWDSLAALRPQLRPCDEVLVIDQNRPALRLPPALAGGWLALRRLETPSLTRARNLGLAEARHRHVIFLDDDIKPEPDLLDQFRRAALAHPGCIITGVVDQTDKPEDVPSPGSVDLRTGEIRTNFSRPLSGEVPYFPGGLSLIPKSALPSGAAAAFCPAFRGASYGEEIDFALRARRRGVKIIADPAVRIFHLRAVEGGCRAPEFRRRFFLDHVFNQSLFFARHGQVTYLAGFLRRLKGFVEFHSRKERGHSRALVLRALGLTAEGLLRGFFYRFSD